MNKRQPPKHDVVRLTDWSCQCRKCGITWHGESDIHRPFSETINLRTLEGGRNKCYGRYRGDHT